MTAEYEHFRPNLEKNNVDKTVNQIVSHGEGKDPLTYLDGKNDKFKKFVLLRLLSKRIIQVLGSNVDAAEDSDAEVEAEEIPEVIGLARINYIPFVYNMVTSELSPHFDNITNSEKPLDKAVIDNVNSAGKNYEKVISSGRDAAAYHLGTFLNYVCYEHTNLNRSELIKILNNSYGYTISSFMNINQVLFSELYNTQNGLSVVKEYEDIGQIEILNPELFSLSSIKKGEEQAVIPDWTKIGNLKIRNISSPIIQLEIPIKAKEFEPKDETIGCPFHDYVKELYPRLIEKIRLMD